VILLDVLLDEPGPSPGEDATLAQAMRQVGNVVLPATVVHTGVSGQAKGVVPLDLFASAAWAVGHTLLTESAADGVLRRLVLVPPPVGEAGFPQGSFAAIGAAALDGSATAAGGRRSSAAPQPGRHGRPGAQLIDFAGPAGTYFPLPARLFLEDQAAASLLAGRIVIVGSALPESHDAFLSPFSSGGAEGMSGVEVQANCVAALLARRPLRTCGPTIILAAT